MRRARGTSPIEPLEPRRLLTLAGAQLFTTPVLATPGLVGTYVNQSLHTYSPQDDWRVTQSVSGTRVDPVIEFGNSLGTRAPVGITGGTDDDWDNFSVQWDGYLKVTTANTRFATKSDDGSRMWIDLNNDGVFAASGPEFLNNHWGAGQNENTGDRSTPLAAGVYKIRIQYYEIAGGNAMTLVSSPLAPATSPITATNPRQVVKVLVLDFDPHVPGYQNRLLHDVMGWLDPRYLADGYEHDLEWASGGAVDFQIVDWRDLDQIPALTDGFRYNPDDYVQRYRNGGPWHTQANGSDFYAIAEEQHIADLVNSGAVDELWTFAAPYFGIPAESFMAGPNSFFVNGPSFPDFPVDRAIVGYGFNYERGIAEMIHDNGHRTENHIARAYNYNWNINHPVTPWDKFTANVGQTASAPYGIGSTHYPGNGMSDYDYGSTLTVPSTALDWLNYPNLTGAVTNINRDSWGWGTSATDYQRDYLDWFFGLMPRADGVAADGRQNNWYKYIYDFNSYEEVTGLPRQEDAFASPGVLRTAGPTPWTFTVRYYDVTGVNPATLGPANIRVTGPNGFSALATLVSPGTQVATTAGTARTVTYQVTAPGGTWDTPDLGTYTISIEPSQVRDTLGNFFPPGQIGSFRVELPDTSRIDVNALVATGHAVTGSTQLDIGPIDNIFDGNVSTIVRTPNINPAFFQVNFDSPQTLRGFRSFFAGGASYQWNVETADTQSDLDSHTGSWRQAVPVTSTFSEQFSVVMLVTPIVARIVRLNVTRTSGDGYVHVNEFQILGPVSTDTTPPVASMPPLTNVTTPGGTSYFLPVTYTDSTAVSVASLNSANLLVTGPNGFSAHATFYDVSDYFNGATRAAQYYFIPPGGVWDSADNGTYTVTLLPSQVLDTVGNAAASAVVLGSFTANIPPPVRRPFYDLTEMNAAFWSAGAVDATASTFDDPNQKLLGAASIRFETTGGFDTWLSFPPAMAADWDLSIAHYLYFNVLASNPSPFGFQENSPMIRLRDSNGGYFEYAYYMAGSQYALLNDARGTWHSYNVPLLGSATQNNGWRRTVVGSPRMDHISSLEFHADTWDAGFTLWYDQVGFDIPVTVTAASFQPTPHSLTLTFDVPLDPLSLSNTDLELRNQLTGVAVPLHAALAPNGTSASFTFPFLPSQKLPTGVYRATLPANSVADPAGNLNTSPFTYDFILVNDADTLTLPASTQPYPAQQLALLGTGRLNLTTNSLLLTNIPPSAFRPFLATGQLYSIAPDPTHTHSIGYAPSAAAILVKQTLIADANLDGVVNADDTALFDRGRAKSLDTWWNGDFNHDGQINSTDAAILHTALAPSSPSPNIAATPATRISTTSIATIPKTKPARHVKPTRRTRVVTPSTTPLIKRLPSLLSLLRHLRLR